MTKMLCVVYVGIYLSILHITNRNEIIQLMIHSYIYLVTQLCRLTLYHPSEGNRPINNL